MSAKKIFLFLTLSLAALLTLTLASCGGSGGSGSSSTGDGTLKLSLTDSATRDYRAIYVTIDRVDVHRADGNWEVVANPQATYDLLELVNGVTVVLGEDLLPAGDYTQMRLIIGTTADNSDNLDGLPHPYANYLVMADDSINQLKIPSGPQTGIKLVSGFTINANQTTELLLDFDAMRSVVKAGASGLYLLKPTIKVLHVANVTSVEGTITTMVDDVSTPLSGTFVSAQSGDPLDIQAGTISADNGGYKLFLEPGGYTLVATADGFLPACDSLALATNDQQLLDFDLTAADPEMIYSLSGEVTVTFPDEDQSVTLTFYQEVTCNDATSATVVVRELNVAAGGSYEVSLPAGEYKIVATTIDEDEVESTIEFSINLDTNLVENFNF